MTSDEYAAAVEPYDAALRMIHEAIEELFGPTADIASDEALPTPTERAEAIIRALQMIRDKCRE